MPSEVYSQSVNRGGQTQTLSKLSSDRVEARRGNIRPQRQTDKENGVPNALENDNSMKRNSIISTGQVLGDGKQNSNDSTLSSKDQRNNFSLVRNGYSNLNSNSKPKGKPKAKIQPTPRGSYDSMGSNAIPSDELHSSTDGTIEEGDQYSNQTENTRNPQEQKTTRTKSQEVPSVRKRFYENADMEDVLQEKVATQLRENGIAETRVASLSAKICQAVRDDVMNANDKTQPQVFSNLTSAIHNHLDVILYNYAQHTELSNTKTHDATNISQIVLMRVAQIHNELDSCKQSLDDALKSSPRRAKANDVHGDGTTPRDTTDSQERSIVMVIKEGIEAQKTDAEILADKIKQLEGEGNDVDQLRERHKTNIKTLDEENWQLKKCLQEADQDNEVLVAKVKDQEVQQEKLDKSIQACQKEIDQLKKQIGEMKSQGRVTSKELAALQSEKARLQVLCDQRQKEIVHLRDPDRELILKIRALKEEVTVLRTQSRRLGEERGMLRSKSQKLESALDESLKVRTKLVNERDVLFKENQELRQRYRKLSLSTPSQRTLPDILTPRHGMSTRSTSRSTSRADTNVLVLKNPTRDESKLSTHKEEQEEDQQR